MGGFRVFVGIFLLGSHEHLNGWYGRLGSGGDEVHLCLSTGSVSMSVVNTICSGITISGFKNKECFFSIGS
jgi:hypothetical protein